MQSTLSHNALDSTVGALQDSVGLWISVLDAVTAAVVPDPTDARVPSESAADAEPDADTVGSADEAMSTDVGKAVEMVEITHNQKLHPGAMAVVVLVEALLQALTRVVSAEKHSKGPVSGEGMVSTSTPAYEAFMLLLCRVLPRHLPTPSLFTHTIQRSLHWSCCPHGWGNAGVGMRML